MAYVIELLVLYVSLMWSPERGLTRRVLLNNRIVFLQVNCGKLINLQCTYVSLCEGYQYVCRVREKSIGFSGQSNWIWLARGLRLPERFPNNRLICRRGSLPNVRFDPTENRAEGISDCGRRQPRRLREEITLQVRRLPRAVPSARNINYATSSLGRC